MNGNWFPWTEGVNGNTAGRIRHRLAPRARHLHRGRRDQRRPGSGARTSTRTTRFRTSARSTPATPTSTGPASTATTGAPTRPPDRWRTFDQLFSSTYNTITSTIAPAQADDDRRGRLAPSTAAPRRTWITDMLSDAPDQLPEGPRPALVRQVRRRHGLADRDLEQRHQRLRRRHPEPRLRGQRVRLPGRLRPRSSRPAERLTARLVKARLEQTSRDQSPTETAGPTVDGWGCPHASDIALPPFVALLSPSRPQSALDPGRRSSPPASRPPRLAHRPQPRRAELVRQAAGPHEGPRADQRCPAPPRRRRRLRSGCRKLATKSSVARFGPSTGAPGSATS